MKEKKIYYTFKKLESKNKLHKLKTCILVLFFFVVNLVDFGF